jgi:hypothetical protein
MAVMTACALSDQHCACFDSNPEAGGRPASIFDNSKTTYPIDRQQSERESRKTISNLQPSECMRVDGNPGEQEKQGESHESPDGDLQIR